MKAPWPTCPDCNGPGVWTPGPRPPLRGWWVCALCRKRWGRDSPPEYLRLRQAGAPELFDREGD